MTIYKQYAIYDFVAPLKENLEFAVKQSWKKKVWKTFFCSLENLESFLQKNNVSKFLFLLILLLLLHIKTILNFLHFLLKWYRDHISRQTQLSRVIPEKQLFYSVASAHLPKPWEIPVRDFILAVYLLVPLACNFTKRWTPCQIIYKVYDHKSTTVWLLFCQTHFNSCSWFSCSFRSPQMEIEKNHSPANYFSWATHILWMEIKACWIFLFGQMNFLP